MVKTIHVHRCKCGRNAISDELKDGYPALRCSHCGARWWHTTCFKNHNHVIDGRFAKRCSVCGWYHCPICGACRPFTQPDGECNCQGDCPVASELTLEDEQASSADD